VTVTMTRLLLLLAAGALETCGIENTPNTGGPYKGTRAINREPQGQCIDNKGQKIPQGMLFEPGPDECQVCTCLLGQPVHCRTVLCAPPQGCHSLRVGDACCEWVCDQWEQGDLPTQSGGVSDLGLRLVASAVTAIVSLCLLFFLIYRLRQRKLRGRQNHLEAESYNSMPGVSEDPLDELADGYHATLKPRVSQGFPPSYNEAMFGQGDPQEEDFQMEPSLEEQESPPYYGNIDRDPVISYPVATLGRLVLPPPPPSLVMVRRDGEEDEVVVIGEAEVVNNQQTAV